MATSGTVDTAALRRAAAFYYKPHDTIIRFFKIMFITLIKVINTKSKMNTEEENFLNVYLNTFIYFACSSPKKNPTNTCQLCSHYCII